MNKNELRNLLDDDTSTSAGSVDIPDLKRQITNHIQQQMIHGNPVQQQVKNVHNSVYGSSPVTERSKEVFKEKVEITIEEYPHKCAEFDGRDYESIRDSLYDALRHVEENHYQKDGYTWFIHPETMHHVQDLYQLFNRLGRDRGIASQKNFVLLGIPFKQVPTVPEGWVLLAQKEKFKGSGAYSPARPHPMSLIRNMDAGFREQVRMQIGGTINFRVMNV